MTLFRPTHAFSGNTVLATTCRTNPKTDPILRHLWLSYLKIVKVDDIIKGWTCIHEGLPPLFLFGHFFDNLDNCAGINWSKAEKTLSAPFVRSGKMTHCFSTGKLVVMASGGCIGSYASLRYTSMRDSSVCILQGTHVASLPAYFSMILLPPGCSARYLSG